MCTFDTFIWNEALGFPISINDVFTTTCFNRQFKPFSIPLLLYLCLNLIGICLFSASARLSSQQPKRAELRAVRQKKTMRSGCPVKSVSFFFFFCGARVFRRTPPAQGGAGGSVRILLTINPATTPKRSNERPRTWQLGHLKERAGFLVSRCLTLPSTPP